MLEYIYDFLSLFFDKLKDRNKIKSIILFGSFARGNPRNDSDIDLFIDIEEINKKEIESIARESLNEFELKSSKSWNLKGIKNVISPIIDNIEKEQWNELRKEISSYGILLYGRYEIPIMSKKRYFLIEYDLSKSKQKDKMKIIRRLLGYKLKRGKKIYEQKGLIEKFSAEKISNSILIDAMKYKEIYALLKKEKIPVKIRNLASID